MLLKLKALLKYDFSSNIYFGLRATDVKTLALAYQLIQKHEVRGMPYLIVKKKWQELISYPDISRAIHSSSSIVSTKTRSNYIVYIAQTSCLNSHNIIIFFDNLADMSVSMLMRSKFQLFFKNIKKKYCKRDSGVILSIISSTLFAQFSHNQFNYNQFSQYQFNRNLFSGH